MTQKIEVPFTNLASQHSLIKEELMQAVEKVLNHGKFVLGDEVNQFEKQFADLCGVNFAVGVNSGTDALILSLQALGIGPGAEVITVPNSFVATASCISVVGAAPVFVDVQQDLNINTEQIERAITSKTRAIIPVHMTGHPADMSAIIKIAKSYGLAIIEDSAQAVCSEYNGQMVGSFGSVGCFSLHPLKTLNACGDGGVVTTNDEKIYNKIRLLRNMGLEKRDNAKIWSSNSRLDTIQAALLLVKLSYLEQWIKQRISNAHFYQKELGDINEISIPKDSINGKSTYHTFVIQAQDRDDLKQYLKTNGISTAIHYPIPIHLQKAANYLKYKLGDFPVAEKQSKMILSLPIYHGIDSPKLKFVSDHIRTFYNYPRKNQ
tara:strand:+ start:424 stop:1554 length:1131 start_codon:yes stop_codon:yes gene_type:complete